jgi:hypothetical protein
MAKRHEMIHESGTKKIRFKTTIWSSGERWRARVYVLVDKEWILAWERRSRSREGLLLLAAAFRCSFLQSTLSLRSFLGVVKII